MSEDDAGGGRRAWRTDREWMQLRERLAAAEAAPVEAATRRSANGRATGSRSRVTFVTGIAAVLIGVVSALLLRTTPHGTSTRVVATTAGQRVTIHLADSSVVMLGPSSSVRYFLDDTLRAVELTGLADFRVRHDARRPFVVRARNAKTVDVGTEFVVRAYAEDSVVTVAVASGQVALSTLATAAPPRQLGAGEVGSVARDGSVIVQQRADVGLYSAWIDGRLIFRNQSLAEVATELGRQFDVDIRIQNAALSRRHVSGIYSDASLDAVLDVLTAALDARYEQRGRTITISPRQR